MLKIKNTLFATLIFGIALFLVSCDKDEPEIVEELSFQVNGKTVSFLNPNAGLNIFDRLVVSGSEGEDHEITVGVFDTNSGTFTEDDIDKTVGSLESNYDLSYIDDKGNFYSYYSSDENTNFSITIDEFGTEEGGLVSGTFSGVLFGSFFNGENAVDSVVIENGTFKVMRANATLANIY